MTINIPDNWLKTALTQVFGKNITEENLAKLDRIEWDEYRAEAGMKFGAVYDLTGLEFCKKLREICMDGNAVESLEPIRELTELEEIWLVGSGLKSVPDLSKLTKLKTLTLNSNYKLKDISGIKGLPALQELNISSTEIVDLSILETLPKLNELSLYQFKGDLSAHSTNRTLLIKFLQKGVQITMTDVETLKAEAIATMPEGSSGDLISFLKSQGGFKLAGAVEAQGINGQTGDKGNRPLHLALISFFTQKETFTDQFAVVKRLIEEGADVQLPNKDGYSPLMLYLENNREASLDMVKQLIEHGANPNLTDLNVNTYYANLNHVAPLVLAATAEKPEIVEYLIEKGADFTQPHAMYVFAQYGYEKYIRMAIEEKSYPINYYHSHLGTVLHGAVFGKQSQLIKYLIEKGADVNACNEYGRTPLFNASRGEDAQQLIDAGAKVDAQTTGGDTPYLSCESFYRHEVAKVLAANGANLDKQNSRGQTMLHIIELSRYDPQKTYDTITYLVEKGANLNILDKDNMTVRDAHKGDLKKLFTKLGGKTGKALLKEKE